MWLRPFSTTSLATRQEWQASTTAPPMLRRSARRSTNGRSMCSSLSDDAMRSGAAQPLSHPSQCKGPSRGERDVLYASVEFIEERTSYHSEVARRVASGALDRAPCASLVLAVTGVGGPGRHEGNPPRLIWLGATLRGHGLV